VNTPETAMAFLARLLAGRRYPVPVNVEPTIGELIAARGFVEGLMHAGWTPPAQEVTE
jgi:hypothetical protein